MIGIEQYRKIQEYKAFGLAQTKTAKALGITYSSVSKYWNMDKEDYEREAKKERYHCKRQPGIEPHDRQKVIHLLIA